MEDKEEKKTILHFSFINNEKARLNQFFKKIELEVAKICFEPTLPKDKKESLVNNPPNSYDKIKTIYKDLSESNDIEINIQLDDNRTYYNELIHLIPLDKSDYPNITLDYPIYKDKINNIYIDEENNNKDNNVDKAIISLEIIYQTTNSELLPKKIIYKGKELTCFDTFKNKYRQRIGLCNVNPANFDFMEDINKKYPLFKFQNENSYQILVRIPIEGNKQYSIANHDLRNLGLQKQKLKYKGDKQKLLDLLRKFKHEFNSTFVQTSYEQIDKVKELFIKLYNEYKILEYEKNNYYDKVFNFTNFEDNDVSIFVLMFYYCEFQELNKFQADKEKEYKIIDLLDFLSDFNKEYEKYINEIEDLKIDLKDKLLLIKAYNNKFIDSFMLGYQIDYITIIDIEREKKSNPYIKSLKFIKNIIMNIKEESRLFEVFLYLDSEIIENILIKSDIKAEGAIEVYGENNKLSKNPTEYGINMITVDEIINHLLNLIPRYIIRIDTRLKFNVNFDPNTKIMILNERQLFNSSSKGLNKTFTKEKVSDKYIMPITIKILHELFGHGKQRLSNDDAKSPQEYRDSKHNYKRISIKKKMSDNKEIIFPESGVVLENFISEDRKVLNWLKKIHPFEEVKCLFDTSLWIDNNFEKLEKIVGDNVNKDDSYKEYNSKYSSIFYENDDSLDYSDDTCGFHKYENRY